MTGGYRYINNIDLTSQDPYVSKANVDKDYWGKNDVTRMTVLDLNQIELKPIIDFDTNGTPKPIVQKEFAKSQPDFISAITGSFGEKINAGDKTGSREIYGEIYVDGRLILEPTTQGGKSVARKRYALAINKNTNKAEVVLGGWKPEYASKYKFWMGGLGLLVAPENANPKDYPTEQFNLVPDLLDKKISTIQNYDPRNSKYLPLVRDRDSAWNLDNKRGEFGQTNLTSRTAIVITKTGELVFVYLEDQILIEDMKPMIEREIAKQGYEVSSILVTDGGVRSRLFHKDETDNDREIFKKIQDLTGGREPTTMIGAFEKKQ